MFEELSKYRTQRIFNTPIGKFILYQIPTSDEEYDMYMKFEVYKVEEISGIKNYMGDISYQVFPSNKELYPHITKLINGVA